MCYEGLGLRFVIVNALNLYASDNTNEIYL